MISFKNWSKGKKLDEIWATCARGDWLLELYAELYPENHRLLSFAKGHCAKTVQHLLKDQRSLDAIQGAIDYGLYQIDEQELALIAIHSAAAAQATVVNIASGSYAIYAAANSAYAAADKDSNPATTATLAAYAAVYEASNRNLGFLANKVCYEARSQNQRATANICRRYLTIDVTHWAALPDLLELPGDTDGTN